MSPEDPRHGKRSGYLAGCRCEPCVIANKRYCKAYKNRAYATGTTTVAVADVMPHLEGLLERASLSSIATAAGLSSGHLIRIMRQCKRIHPHTAQKLLDVTLDKIAATQFVSAIGATRRIQSLHALGYSMQRLDTLLGGYGKQNLELVAHGKRTQITAAWDRRIRAMWDDLSMRLPEAANHYEQAGITKSLARSKRFGWLPPLAFDDIDDPNEQPAHGDNQRHNADVDRVVVERVMAGENLPTTRAEKDEIVRRWRALGWSLNELERRTGWKCDRYGREPLQEAS